MAFRIYPNLLYRVTSDNHGRQELTRLLNKHPEISFVSFSAIDIAGNDTDEKIPVKLFIRKMDEYLGGAIQTDGSSVVLPLITSINDAQVDFIADLSVDWYVDYNYEHIDPISGLPVGTLRIPCFLRHHGELVCSRSLLRRSMDYFNEQLRELLASSSLTGELSFNADQLDHLELTLATELEFWVRTPDDIVTPEHLSTSQGLKEQYWKRTKGVVRTALEATLKVMELYGFRPEMGHKEVGGVKAHLNCSGQMDHIMEQLEIDWMHAEAMQAIDREYSIRILIKEIFRLHGLEVTFLAKPIPGVAGSGEHTHLNVICHDRKGERYNLFAPQNPDQDYLSAPGWGALMGLLKHYNHAVAPFVTCSNNAFKRMQPGFEAPTHAVASIGRSIEEPSRNRTVLIGVIRSNESPLSTRFELRGPHPHSNLYFLTAASCQAMLDGIRYVVREGKSSAQLQEEALKTAGESADYLPADYQYVCEDDLFEKYTTVERDRLFGEPARNVHQTLNRLVTNQDAIAMLCTGNVFTERVIASYVKAMLDEWELELNDRILEENTLYLRSLTRLHPEHDHYLPINTYDQDLWDEIQQLRYRLGKTTHENLSLFDQIRLALAEGSLRKASQLQETMDQEIEKLAELYQRYEINQIDLC